MPRCLRLAVPSKQTEIRLKKERPRTHWDLKEQTLRMQLWLFPHFAWGSRSSEMLRCITGWLLPDVSTDNVVVSCWRVRTAHKTNMFSRPRRMETSSNVQTPNNSQVCCIFGTSCGSKCHRKLCLRYPRVPSTLREVCVELLARRPWWLDGWHTVPLLGQST